MSCENTSPTWRFLNTSYLWTKTRTKPALSFREMLYSFECVHVHVLLKSSPESLCSVRYCTDIKPEKLRNEKDPLFYSLLGMIGPWKMDEKLLSSSFSKICPIDSPTFTWALRTVKSDQIFRIFMRKSLTLWRKWTNCSVSPKQKAVKLF